jgi:hypothetical protein
MSEGVDGPFQRSTLDPLSGARTLVRISGEVDAQVIA